MLMLALIAVAAAGAAPQSTNPAVWAHAGDYVRQDGALFLPSVRIELTVDENGDPVHCNILPSDEVKGSEHRYCLVPMRRAHFKPARDEDGRPIAGVFSTNFQRRGLEHGSGPDWVDYSLTVSALPDQRPRSVTARVVTDSAGRVESCVVDRASGVAKLDDLACRYTRQNLTLAAPFDRDGHPVRAMRLVTIGFAAAG